MLKRKPFLPLAILGAALVCTPFLYRHFAGPADPILPSTAEYFPVQDGLTGLWGFIDSQGNPITPMVFDWAGDFRQGLGLAEMSDAGVSSMGYIDATFNDTGKWAITPRFDLSDPTDQAAFGFFEGRALVRDDDGLWGYIDTTGKWAIEPRFAESPRDYPGTPAGSFSDGLAWFQVIEMDERHAIDDNDEFIRDDEGKIMKEQYPRRTIGFIDRQGNVAIKPRYVMASDFGQGLAGVRFKSQGEWGFIDKDDKRVIAPRFHAVGRFSEGLCAICINNKWGYIDREGEDKIERQFDDAGDFSEGLAAARQGNQWGYIDKTGQWAIPPIYDHHGHAHPHNPRPFENGLAKVTLDGQRIYINPKGEQIWPKP